MLTSQLYKPRSLPKPPHAVKLGPRKEAQHKNVFHVISPTHETLKPQPLELQPRTMTPAQRKARLLGFRVFVDLEFRVEALVV